VVAVIEDDSSFRRALSRSLNLRGFRTYDYDSAEEFLRRRAEEPTDCIVLDIHLGGMSGFELQAELAAGGTLTPIVFITAFDDPATRRHAQDVGAAGYLQKPFDDQSLIDTINRVSRRPPRTA
jgi:FixJ family two-component response regulator